MDAEGRTFVFDAENKQIEVKNASNETIGKYWYDADGRRVKKHVPSTGETTVFVYDASSRLVAEYSTILNESPQVAYLTNDHLGSPRINSNENGAVISRHDYRPYGDEVAERTYAQYVGDTIRKQFTGYERDGESELDFSQTRALNPVVGRFQVPDEFLNDTEADSPQSWNLFVYVRNRPSVSTDPSGQEVFEKDLTETEKQKIISDWKQKTGFRDIQFVGGKLIINDKAGFDKKVDGKRLLLLHEICC